MAYDEGAAALLRDELVGTGEVREQKMFGGLCFMVNGHMVCGVHKGGGMFRVGKDAHGRGDGDRGCRADGDGRAHDGRHGQRRRRGVGR